MDCRSGGPRVLSPPRRDAEALTMWQICLAGSVRVTPGVGDAVTISAGDTRLMEDTTGSGHTTEVVSKGPFEAVVIQLPDDAPLGRA
jgi:hypothetical protein